MAKASISDVRAPTSLSYKFRTRRDIVLRSLISSVAARVKSSVRILDLGGTADYWARVGFDFLSENDVRVTCVNQSDSEFGVSLAGTSRVDAIVADARNLSGFADNSFDMAHSNSVIEHVGRFEDMRRFASELRRLAPAHYVQTPYFWCPIDPHFHRIPFVHWLPAPLRAKTLQRMRVGYSPAQPDLARAMSLVESSMMLDAGQFRYLFPDSRITFERIYGLPKSMIAIRQ